MMPILENVARKRYAIKVKSKSPTAYWPLWEKSGTTAYDIIGAYDIPYVAGSGGVITLAQPGIGDGQSSALFNGVDTSVGLGSVAFGNAWDGDKGSAIAWGKIDSLARWGDGLVGWWFHIRSNYDPNYNLVFGKIGTNQIQWRRRTGVISTLKSITKTFTDPPTGWFMMGMTWDTTLATPVIKGYYNGVLEGSVASVAMTSWLASEKPDGADKNTLYAGSNAAQEWFGYGAHVAWWNGIILSDSDMLYLGRRR